MPAETPFFSIVTPTFNSEKTIKATVQSILMQTDSDFEHLIIDNLSTDNTLEIIKSLYEREGRLNQLKILSERDSGISSAFNKGVRLSQGSVIAIINSDDSYADKMVFDKVRKSFGNSDTDIVHGILIFDDPVHGRETRKPFLGIAHEAMPINHPTMFARKSVYEKIGNYGETYRLAMDHDWVLRAQIANMQFEYLPEIITVMDGNGVSGKNEIAALKEIERILQSHNQYGLGVRFRLSMRILRVKIKTYLYSKGITKPIKLWRRYKFKS